MEERKIKLYDKGGKSITALDYEGVFLAYPLPTENLEEHMQAIRNMPSRPNDVLIASFPKSGTHWLLEAINMLLRNSREYFGKDLPNPTGKPDGMPLLENIHMDKFELLKSPRLMISHLRPSYIPRNFKGKIIYLTRNPKDIAVSYYTFVSRGSVQEYEGKWDDFLHLFIEGKVVMGPVFTYLREWKDVKVDHPELNVLSVTYEELHKDFLSTLKRISTFLTIDATDSFLQEIHERCNIDKIRQSRIDSPDDNKDFFFPKDIKGNSGSHYLYRKGVVGDWKNWFTVAQSEMFDAAYEKEMRS